MEDTLGLIVSLAAATLRVATPLILAALAGMFSERSGVVDIGLEGKMLAAAFFSASTALVTGSAWLGLCAGVASAVALAMVHGLASITYNGNQMVSGLALNVLVAGLTPLLATVWFQQAGRTPTVPNGARFLPVSLPGAEAFGTVPLLGPLYRSVVSGHNVLVYLAIAAVPLAAWILFRTRFGLRLRAVGENPHALDTAGVNVAWMRYRALAIGGVLCGFAGTYLSIGQGAGFIQDMTAGRGFLALAALIFGKWLPVPTLLACFLFAFTDAVQVRLQGVPLPGIGVIPVQFIQAIPYVLTVLLLAGFVGKAVAPKAIGLPYVKSR
ncbi:MAG: ABC transporter permease [Alphaproteobacteria bacterium]|nr:MAG: ABC transporter permease [Alphaproteobacteria bacterium]